MKTTLARWRTLVPARRHKRWLHTNEFTVACRADGRLMNELDAAHEEA